MLIAIVTSPGSYHILTDGVWFVLILSFKDTTTATDDYVVKVFESR